MKLNNNFNRLSSSYLFYEVSKRVDNFRQRNPNKKVINLGIGDVSLPLSREVCDAMKNASLEMGAADKQRGYPPPFGYDFLRNAISQKYNTRGIDIKSDEIYIGDGAKSDCTNITRIFDKSDVIITSPVYPVYFDSNTINGNKIIIIDTNESEKFIPHPDNVDRNTHDAIIFLCSPNNPTGVSYGQTTLEQWVKFALDTNSLIVFDSAYGEYVRSSSPRSIYEIENADKCSIEISSFSKSYGFTGVRCSWTVIPHKLCFSGTHIHKVWERFMSTTFNGVSYITQRGAQAAIKRDLLSDNNKEISYYLENAKILSSSLESNKIVYFGGIDSPYIFTKIINRKSSWEAFDLLLEKESIVCTPGVGFGENADGYIRLSSLCKREDAIEASYRFNEFFGRINGY